jgi:dihydrofolate reductase
MSPAAVRATPFPSRAADWASAEPTTLDFGRHGSLQGMSELTFKIHTSLDGFVGRPDGDVSWLDPGFEDEELVSWELDLLWRTDLHLMGRVLYDEMAAYWPTSTEPFAAPMNEIPKAVLSRTAASAPWANDHILSGDLTDGIGRLKKSSRDGILFHGGASTGRELARLGLIDRWILVHHPVALGAGLPIFDAEQLVRLEQSHVFRDSGAVALTYRPA